MGQARKPKTLVVARAPADSGTKTAYRPRNQADSRAWSHVLHKGGPTRLLRRGRRDARAPKIMSDGRRASLGSRAPLQRCYNVFGGLATAKGATATDRKLCRRSAPHATRRGRSGQPPNSARTCLGTLLPLLAPCFVF